ncbi:hypothetical protein SHL15_7607 [Streptomyces hygroscopicus subsp. limoneus]|nr:hypothetical protein SHL15_7607 [Streptomyces hygroscopicus subsp. limoneus]
MRSVVPRRGAGRPPGRTRGEGGGIRDVRRAGVDLLLRLPDEDAVVAAVENRVDRTGQADGGVGVRGNASWEEAVFAGRTGVRAESADSGQKELAVNP